MDEQRVRFTDNGGVFALRRCQTAILVNRKIGVGRFLIQNEMRFESVGIVASD